MSMPLLCVSAESGMSAPNMRPPRIVSNTEQHRSRSPLSDNDDEGPVPYYDRKRTRTLRFPCKARGVPDNHNARTAYIDVPPDASHGTIVICSHPVCVSSGRKFRYCSVCMIPVAKRNFSKRHAHGLLESPPELPPHMGVKGEEDQDDDCSVKSKRQRLGTFASWGEALKLLEDDLVETEVPKTIIVDPTVPSVAEAYAEVSDASFDSTLTTQERQWLALFRQRPINGAINEPEVRSWMSAILETAELKTSSPNSPDESMAHAEDENDNEDSSILDFLMDDDFLANGC